MQPTMSSEQAAQAERLRLQTECAKQTGHRSRVDEGRAAWASFDRNYRCLRCGLRFIDRPRLDNSRLSNET